MSLAVILVLGVKEHTDTLVPGIHVEFEAPWRPHNLQMTPRREYAISDSGPHSGVWRSVEGVIRGGDTSKTRTALAPENSDCRPSPNA